LREHLTYQTVHGGHDIDPLTVKVRRATIY